MTMLSKRPTLGQILMLFAIKLCLLSAACSSAGSHAPGKTWTIPQTEHPAATVSESLSQTCAMISPTNQPGSCITNTGGSVAYTNPSLQTCTAAQNQCWTLQGVNSGGWFTNNNSIHQPADTPWCLGISTSATHCHTVNGIYFPLCMGQCTAYWWLGTGSLADGVNQNDCLVHDSSLYLNEDSDGCIETQESTEGFQNSSWVMTGFQTAIGTEWTNANGVDMYLSFDPNTGNCTQNSVTIEAPTSNNLQNNIWQPTTNNFVNFFWNPGGFTIGPNFCGGYTGENTWMTVDENLNVIWSSTSGHVFQIGADPGAPSHPVALFDTNTGLCIDSDVNGRVFEDTCTSGRVTQYVFPIYK